MLQVCLIAFLACVAVVTSDAVRNKTFNLLRLDSTVTTFQYPWQQASGCFYDQRLKVLTCMENFPYENVTSVWKQSPEKILYVSVNCLTRRHRLSNTCVCKSAPSTQNPSKPELYTRCQLTRLEEGILTRLVNLEVLDLSFNRIETVSQRALTSLKKLKYLSLSNNIIKEIPPGFLCQVTGLEYLGLSELALSAYPDRGFRCKNDFTSLKVMDIRGGKYTEIPDDALDQLPVIQSLDLSFTPITEIKKKAFSGGKLLEFLDLSNCNISSIFPYFCDHLPHTSRVYLHGNNFTTFDFTTLEKCSSLTHLDISSNTIRALYGNISHLRALTAIHLGFNRLTAFNNFTFNGLENLTALFLSNNSLEILQSDTFAGLTKLFILDLSKNNISDSTNIETAFSDLESLYSLDLSFNSIGNIPEKSLARLQKLKHLLLNHNAIAKLQPLSFYGLNSLDFLTLDNNRLQTLPDDIFLPFVPHGDINGTVFSHLSLPYNNISDLSNVNKWPVTEYLDISHNKLSSVPSAIDYAKMKTFNVSHNELVSFFGKQENLAADFENMKEVDISFNAIADIETGKLQKMTNVEYINAESNKLSFHLNNNTFERMTKLIRLNLANNMIQTIDNPFSEGSFQNLTLLNISSNPIQNLGSLSQYYNGSRLETIDLARCNLTAVGAETFRGLLNLKSVDLRENLIETFPPFFANVSTRYNLNYNPIVCACNMTWLKERFVNFTKEDKKVLVSNYKVPKCKVYTEDPVYYPRDLLRRQFMCPEVDYCDPQCACFKTEQNGNITTIECQNNLPSVPKLSSNALSIFLDGNNFKENTSLSGLSFLTKMAAKELYMNKSYISYLETSLFAPFDRLEILDLSFNLITLLPSGVFKSQTMLKQLYLNDNLIKTIQVNVFENLYSLQELDISGNRLITLSSITSTELSDLDYMKYYFLARNKWACNCSNLGFKDLVDDVLYKIRDRKLLVCGRDSSREIRYVPRSDFLCSGEDNSSNSKKTLIIVIIVVICIVLFLLALFIYFRRELLSVFYYITGCHIPGKTRYPGVHFDAYLTFDPSDQHCASYVHNTLMPKLKNNSYNIQTSSDVIEDLEVTRKIIEDSRSSVFIVDKNFATNTFLVNAFLLANERQRYEKRHKVILVIHGDIDLLTLEPELVTRMRKGDYITARSRLWWQRLVYELPEPSSGFRHGLENEEDDVVVFSSLAEDQSKYVQF